MRKRMLIALATMELASGCGRDHDGDKNGLVNRAQDGLGGDPISMLFTEARLVAVDSVRQVAPQTLSVKDHKTARFAAQWLTDNQFALAEDIDGTPYTWSKDEEAECAKTDPSAKAPIVFSAPVCREDVQSLEDAMRLLVHESTHHLGITDDTTADAVALLLLPYAQRHGTSTRTQTSYDDDGTYGPVTDVKPVTPATPATPVTPTSPPYPGTGAPTYPSPTYPTSTTSGPQMYGWFGAIAYDAATGRIGYSWRAATASDAGQTALQACNSATCRVETTFQDACASLAKPQAGGTAFWARTNSRAESASAALTSCREFNRGECSTVTVCSDGF